ncbi:MAG: hypothetical protein KA419_05645 [Acidobacteria bacterium]|nr:hypothetical protein [Acidobacteriota bacterium]
MAILAYHAGDPFSGSAYGARSGPYGVAGTPTVVVDGSLKITGAANCPSAYNEYLTAFNSRKSVPALVDIRLSWVAENTVTATVANVSGDYAFEGVFFFALVENAIPFSWYSEGTVDHVCRALLPSNLGTTVNIPIGGSVTLQQALTLNPSWDRTNLQVVAFAESFGRETEQAAKIPMHGSGTITLTAPAAGEPAVEDFDLDIQWNTANYSGTVSIFYSTDNGATWIAVAENIANSGVYPWVVPGAFAPACRLKVCHPSGWPAAVSAPFPLCRWGDLDGDEELTAADTLLLERILRQDEPDDPDADLNGDGRINILDLVLLQVEILEGYGE